MDIVNKDQIYTEQYIIDTITEYIESKGYKWEENFFGIKFSTGVDTWLIIVDEIAKDKQHATIRLMHKNIILRHNRRPNEGKVPDFHLQYKMDNIRRITAPVDKAIEHENKWNNKKRS